MGGGGERRAVGKTGLDSLHYIPTRSAAPQDRSPGPLGARYGPRRILSDLRSDRVGKGLNLKLTARTGATVRRAAGGRRGVTTTDKEHSQEVRSYYISRYPTEANVAFNAFSA